MDIYKHPEITHKIIGCAMQVHSFLGLGFPEIVYQRALSFELEKTGMNFQCGLEMPIYYKDYVDPIGYRKVDFLVENLILVELKAVDSFCDAHYNQILNYLKAYKLEVGLLINFGEKSLNFKRFVM